MPTIDFWISIGSTYSYLSVMRVEGVAKARGVRIRWRPFSVRSIMIEQNNIPFRGKPVKMAYMWRDIERRSAGYGIPAQLPAPYPLTEFDLANKIAIVGETRGWCGAYAQATYRRWFQEGLEAGSEPNLSESLREIGQRPEVVIDEAQSIEIEVLYRQATEEAKALGVFGSPSFAVGHEVFWGDDRLDDAIQWALHGRLIY
ncbi:2-hydroxychromene-2-carboxylate isomerase [Methylovirgula sp. 4M-Z18]|uniref:2-hydroxychromene-2-carboxylate isomerase n=1 Tax=Methylovirgula sp. 4M-Z18 TaxID=2293567 RepID=UPI000E2EA90C|nr:2-hydroxychromene-2-carboxylate isomerase [Methylovirgula sp. 4M-Z18]RFB79963.1 2-hydroxychromene-2-carboxylate isomerase [Methylovirgula sp. 4M-Z18]